MRLLETAQGVILVVYVKSNAKESRLELDDDKLVISCRNSPVKGKVNKELLKQLSRLFGRKVELISGFTSRKKKFLISNMKPEDVKKILISDSDSSQLI